MIGANQTAELPFLGIVTGRLLAKQRELHRLDIGPVVRASDPYIFDVNGGALPLSFRCRCGSRIEIRDFNAGGGLLHDRASIVVEKGDRIEFWMGKVGANRSFDDRSRNHLFFSPSPAAGLDSVRVAEVQVV